MLISLLETKVPGNERSSYGSSIYRADWTCTTLLLRSNRNYCQQYIAQFTNYTIRNCNAPSFTKKISYTTEITEIITEM